jgi:glycerate 2-kinase
LIIKNTEALCSHGNIDGRKAVLEILEDGLEAADPYENVKKLIRIQNGRLIIGHRDFEWRTSDGRLKGDEPLVFELSKVGSIYVVGGGKAAQRQAKALEDVLGDLITEGHVNAKKGEQLQLKRIEVSFAGHPMPDEDSVSGSERILEIEQKARKGDIVFFSESGGGSALYALPGPGITLEDLQEINRLLYFELGASMWDTNKVRWQLMVLRGREERYVGEATFIGIHTDERPPGLRVYAGKGSSDAGSYQDAVNVLKRYNVWDRVPESVRTYLEKADPKYGTIRPTELAGKLHYHFRVMGPEYMLDAAKKRAEKLGMNAAIIASSLSDIEARAAGEMLAYMAQEIEVYDRPFKAPCVLLCGGELLVTVGDAKGKGGRNQEFVVSTTPRIKGSKNIVVVSADSDGSDGPTDVAGGIVDGYTLERLENAGLDPFDELSNHDSYVALNELGDTVITGVKGTNVQDLRIVYIGKH